MSTNIKYKLGETYETMDGRKATVISLDGAGSFPIICLVDSKDFPGKVVPIAFKHNGRRSGATEYQSTDLKPILNKREVWVNVYDKSKMTGIADTGCYFYPTEKGAIASRFSGATATKKIVIEWEDGEGL